MKSYVLGFAFDPKEKSVLLLSKNRPEWQRGHLNGVGGSIEGDETPIQAMEREWGEEIYASPASWRLFARLSGKDWECYCFRASVEISGASAVEDEDIMEVNLENRLPSSIIPNLSWLIPMARMINRRDWPFEIREMASMVSGEKETS